MMQDCNNSDKKFSVCGVKATRRWLLLSFYLYIIFSVALVVAGESDLLFKPAFDLDSGDSYVPLACMELAVVCLIPLSLRLFRFKLINGYVVSRGVSAYLPLAMLRMTLIGLPVLFSLFFYYQFMEVAFCYIAIIGLLALLFVYPGEGKCLSELSCDDNESRKEIE